MDIVEIELASLFKPCKDEKGSGESIDLQTFMTCCQGCCGIGIHGNQEGIPPMPAMEAHQVLPRGCVPWLLSVLCCSH